MSDPDRLEPLLTSARLHAMAGDVTFARGAAYAAEGRVQDLALTDGMLTAHVAGTATYQVRLWKHGEEIEYDCSCPVGDALRFCKHGVAAGLAWVAAHGGGDSDEVPAVPETREDLLERIRAFLDGQDGTALRELLLAEAAADEGFRQRLLVREAAHAADPAAVTRLRAVIDRAVDASEFVDYYEMATYAGGISRAVEGVAALIPANPDAAARLAEHAIRRVERVMGRVDDSDGELVIVLDRLQALHLDACLAAPPDPVSLARRLFKSELGSGYGSFSGAAKTYAEVLGAAGLAEYRRLAQAEWDRLPALAPGEKDTGTRVAAYTTTRMMEALARADGDLAALVAIKSRDLSHAQNYRQIAELYRDAGEHDSAREWALRGLDAFPGRPDAGLRILLADEHHRRGDHDQAMELVWAVFAPRPSFEGYRMLHDHASRFDGWAAWRERALKSLREPAVHRAGRSELVRVFLWEADAEAAWREATDGGCSAELWLELARMREPAHPADSLRIYRDQVDAVLADTGDRAYEEAVKLLPRVRDTMARVDGDFGAYLTGLRTTYKRRRKLLAMLDRFERRVAVRV